MPSEGCQLSVVKIDQDSHPTAAMGACATVPMIFFRQEATPSIS